MKVGVKLIIVIILVGVALAALFSWMRMEKRIGEEEALKIANEIISENYPDMVGLDIKVSSYSSKGREFYSITYMKEVTVQTPENENIQLPKIVIVEIDKNTGERYVFVSG